MKDYLVGYTGFVGSNLASEHKFEGVFNSKNIQEAYGGKPDILVYSGVPAEMFYANNNPQMDRQIIEQAMSNISSIEAKMIVLISTVAVYGNCNNADEDELIDSSQLTAYGANRLALERWVKENFKNYLIVRLPAIYGSNLKKNFIYDYINVIPALLTEKKIMELSEKAPELREYYINQENGFYKCKSLDLAEKNQLKMLFQKLGFSALNFTDSRSKYQFYPLKRLWHDIQEAIMHEIKCINLVTPPISISDLYLKLSGNNFINELDKTPFDYDIRTKYSSIFGLQNGYIMSLEEEVDSVIEFVNSSLESGR